MSRSISQLVPSWPQQSVGDNGLGLQQNTHSENQNTVYKVKDKKVYNEATKEIFLIDNTGQLVHRVTTC